jgi:hypothetical protein
MTRRRRWSSVSTRWPTSVVLPAPSIAGDDDEALALRQAIAEIGHSLAVSRRLEPETRVRRQLKRALAQTKMRLVHHRAFRPVRTGIVPRSGPAPTARWTGPRP